MAVGGTRAVDIVGRAQSQRGVERERTGIDAAQHRDGDRHLDHRGDVPAFIGLDADRCVATQLTHIDADFRLVARSHRRQFRCQKPAPRGRWISHGLCLCCNNRTAERDQHQGAEIAMFGMKLRQRSVRRIGNSSERPKSSSSFILTCSAAQICRTKTSPRADSPPF